MVKQCSCCKLYKDLSEFPAHKGRKYGKDSQCKDCRKPYFEKYRAEHKEQHDIATRRWNLRNLEKVNAKSRKYQDKIRKTPYGKLKNAIHNGMYAQLKYNKKGRSAFALLGYSPEELKKHLEKQFLFGMTWENYGKWHIDHIIPISAFNITTAEDEDFKKCWALSNLQPLWAADNIRKFNKLEKAFQPSLSLATDTAP
jgi:hypothetical protein